MSTARFRVQSHTLQGQHIREYPEATALEQEDVLSLAIKQYTPLNNLKPQHNDVTIIAAHACGFPKELYEPLWDELLQVSKGNDFNIRSIWIADMVNHGRSGILNKGNIGPDHGWDDHSRDLLHMINHFRMPRPIIAIGHSLGATQIANLALIHPRLLTHLILIEPIIMKMPAGPLIPGSPSLVLLSTYRRDRWPSREEAALSFRKTFKTWDERVFQLWIQHGLRSLPTPTPTPKPSPTTPTPSPTPSEVTLTTTKLQEVSSYFRPRFSRTLPDLDPEIVDALPFYRVEATRTFKNLPHLRPSTTYISGRASWNSLPHMREERVRATGGGVGGSKVEAGDVVLDGSHFLPMEDVSGCAQAIAERVGIALCRWRDEEQGFRTQWAAQEKVEISQEWMEELEPFVTNMRGRRKNKI